MGMTIKKNYKKDSKSVSKRITKSKRAGLQFPVARIYKMLKTQRISRRVSLSASVYLSAVLEYIMAELLEITGIVANDYAATRLTSRHLKLALNRDSELQALFNNCIFRGSGVVPNINTAILF